MTTSKDWFEFEQFEEGELQSLESQGNMYPNIRQLLNKAVRALRERDRVFDGIFSALNTNEGLLESAEEVLALIPECPSCGPKCRPFQRDWVQEMVKVEEILNIVRVQARIDMAEDHGWPVSPNDLPKGDLEKMINTGREE